MFGRLLGANAKSDAVVVTDSKYAGKVMGCDNKPFPQWSDVKTLTNEALNVCKEQFSIK